MRARREKGITMNKRTIVAGILAAAIALPLAACGGNAATTDTGSASASSSAASDASSSFDAATFYGGQWRGTVEITGESVYGTANGTETMLDVLLNADGTCELVPAEAHQDLLSGTGTWEGDADGVTLTVGDKTISMACTGSTEQGADTLEATASDFGIADFDKITFTYYGSVD